MTARNLYKGRLIQLGIESADLPDGSRLELEIVRHPGGAVVVALDDANQVCLLKQFRFAAGATFIWELPAGCIDKEDQSPLITARRELEEEAGLVAADWIPLGSILTSPGFCDERLHIFLARDLSRVPTRRERHEFIEVHWLPLQQAIEMASGEGEISDAKTVIGLFRAQQELLQPRT